MELSCSQKLSELLKGVTSKTNGYFHCLKILHCFGIKNKLELHKRVCKSQDLCNAIMPSEDTINIKIYQYQKSDQVQFIIYADLEYLIEVKTILQIHPQQK